MGVRGNFCYSSAGSSGGWGVGWIWLNSFAVVTRYQPPTINPKKYMIGIRYKDCRNPPVSYPRDRRIGPQTPMQIIIHPKRPRCFVSFNESTRSLPPIVEITCADNQNRTRITTIAVKEYSQEEMLLPHRKKRKNSCNIPAALHSGPRISSALPMLLIAIYLPQYRNQPLCAASVLRGWAFVNCCRAPALIGIVFH